MKYLIFNQECKVNDNYEITDMVADSYEEAYADSYEEALELLLKREVEVDKNTKTMILPFIAEVDDDETDFDIITDSLEQIKCFEVKVNVNDTFTDFDKSFKTFKEAVKYAEETEAKLHADDEEAYIDISIYVNETNIFDYVR